jgi:hypothetical protein
MTQLSVFGAISAVQRELATVGIAKTQTNDHDRYRFRGIDDVYNALGPVLAKHGLVIFPQITNRETIERQSKSGGTMLHVILDVTYTFAGPDGSTIAVPVIGEAMDRGDKAITKALSAAYKAAAFQTFCIPVEGSEDPDQSTPEIEQRTKTVTDDQLADLQAAIDAAGLTAEKFCTGYKLGSVSALPADKFDSAMGVLAKRAAKLAEAVA